MTDDRPESSERTDDDSAESTDSMDAPGGGPRRVVSNQSVDDILDSLGSPDDGGSSAAPADGTTERREAPDPDVDADETTNGDDDRPASDVDDPVDDDPIDADPSIRSADETESDAPDDLSDPGADGDADDADEIGDTDALAARIESGTVTGADVRAAETGEDRGRTPEVDDIDLSLDDIDASATESPSSPATEAGSTDGPLAGTFRGDDAATGGNAADDADRSGLLDRIRRFFGG